MSSFILLAGLLLFSFFSPNPVWAQSTAIIADHKAVHEFDQIPRYWIEQAKQQFKIAYGHTSHGSQIPSGMGVVRTMLGTDFSFYNPGTNRICSGTGLCLFEGSGYSAGWLQGDAGYWPAWRDETTEFLNETTNSHFNVIMWSWCGQASTATQTSMITNYLQPMANFESSHPNIDFIYMTGHLDGSGVNGNLNLRNEQIRNYVKQNNKILFDFADIESYDPGQNYYLDKAGRDDTGYIRPSDGVTRYWGIDYCSGSSPDQVYCPSAYNSCSCAHSYCINCHMKGRAFWWLLARMAGWPGVTSTSPTPTTPPAQLGDFDHDGNLDFADFRLLLGVFNTNNQNFNLVGSSPYLIDIFDYNYFARLGT